MPFTTKSTELEAVNAVLNMLGESPVASTSGDVPQIVETVVTAIDEADRQTQSRGWWYNRTRAESIDPVGDEIVLGDDALSVRVNDPILLSEGVHLRGNKLYSPKDQATDVFKSAVKLDVVRLLPWDSTPQAHRDYVVARAATEVQKAGFGTDTLVQFLIERMRESMATLQAEHVRYERRTMLNTLQSRRSYGQPAWWRGYR
jgi:hypothetical protein